MPDTTTQKTPSAAAKRSTAGAQAAPPPEIPDSAPATRPSEETHRAYAPDGSTRDGRIAWGFEEFRHKHACPIADERPTDGAMLPERMEGFDVPLPRNAGVTTIVRCLECGLQIRVDPSGVTATD